MGIRMPRREVTFCTPLTPKLSRGVDVECGLPGQQLDDITSRLLAAGWPAELFTAAPNLLS
jgi:hypothetical protein